LHSSAGQALLFTCEISFQNVTMRHSAPCPDMVQLLVYRGMRREQEAGLSGDGAPL
jgi:hypothetical protein